MKEKIHQEIERTLHSLDGIKRAEANPYLFTRIKARMDKKTGWEWVSSFVSRPIIAVAIVLLVMAINGWALWGSNSEDGIAVDNSVSELASEYNNVASVSNYDYENLTNE